jgi:hypothetical protein
MECSLTHPYEVLVAAVALVQPLAVVGVDEVVLSTVREQRCGAQGVRGAWDAGCGIIIMKGCGMWYVG